VCKPLCNRPERLYMTSGSEVTDASMARGGTSYWNRARRIGTWGIALALGLPSLQCLTSGEAPKIRVIVNSRSLVLDPPPIIVRDRVFVPFKETVRHLDAFGIAQEATLRAGARRGGFPAVTLFLNSPRAWILLDKQDCREIALDAAPRVIGGYLMVPLRALAEGVGARVDWDARARRVLLSFAVGQPRSAINAPQPVRAVQVPGEWQVEPSTIPLVCATCDEFPLTLGLSAPEETQFGSPIKLGVNLSNLAKSTVTLRQPAAFHVRIARGTCPVIWEGILPPLTSPIPPGRVHLRFVWAQRDVAGRLVPRGSGYLVQIVFPVAIAYTLDGNPGEERLTSTSGHKLGGEIDSRFIRVR
jgi:hypothetical protein